MNSIESKVLEMVDQEEIVAFMQKLVRARSDYPPGDTREVAQICMDKFKEYGVDAEYIIPPDDVTSPNNDGVDNKTMPSILATIPGIQEGPTILLNAHIDTVQAGDLSQWIHDPFAADIENNCIYGRGSGDDKGSVLAQIMAACILKKANIPLKGTLQVNPVADEEAQSYRGVKWMCDRGILKPDILIVGEQTSIDIACAERAIVYVRVSIKGKASHGAMPWMGNNATVHMARFINLVNEELIPEVQKVDHPYLPKTTLSMTKIEGGIKVNIIPEDCTLCIDCRLTPGITEDYIIKRMNELLQRLSDEGQPFQWNVEAFYSEGGIATNTSPESPLIQAMIGAAEEIKGGPQKLIGYKQASDGRVFAKLGIPIAIFGPGDPAYGHSPNEFVPIDELVKATKILILTIMRLMHVEE